MFRGSYTALVTPFKNGAFDRKTFEKQIEFQARNGTNGIVPVGTTGESPTLSHEEHHLVIEVAVQAAKGTGMKVIAGTGSNATDEALDLTRYAKRAGADGVLQVIPYYNKPTQEGMFRHFKAIADAVDIPMILYNIPGRTGVSMTVATMGRLAGACPSIVAMKDAAGDVNITSEIVGATKLTVLSGDDAMVVPMMSVGAVGVISVASNIIPKEMRQLVDAGLANNFAAAREIHHRYLQLFKTLFVETNPIGVKTAMELLGRDSGELRLPMCEASSANRLVIRQALINAGLMAEGRA